MLPDPTDIATALDAHQPLVHPALPGRTNHRCAGVLVPLTWREGSLWTVLGERSPHLAHHPGEVSWPGGRPEPEDADLAATALREAAEEVGLHGATVLGRLSSTPLFTSDFRLEPFVGHSPEQQLHPDGDEMVALLPLDLKAALFAAHIDAIPWDYEGQRGLSPVWELRPGIVCFGATAHVLHELLTVLAPLFGQPLPPLRPGRFTWQDMLG